MMMVVDGWMVIIRSSLAVAGRGGRAGVQDNVLAVP
jgi:hypothetical protein